MTNRSHDKSLPAKAHVFACFFTGFPKGSTFAGTIVDNRIQVRILSVGTCNADIGTPDMARQMTMPQLPAKRDYGSSCS